MAYIGADFSRVCTCWECTMEWVIFWREVYFGWLIRLAPSFDRCYNCPCPCHTHGISDICVLCKPELAEDDDEVDLRIQVLTNVRQYDEYYPEVDELYTHYEYYYMVEELANLDEFYGGNNRRYHPGIRGPLNRY